MAFFAAVCCGQYRFYRRAHRLRLAAQWYGWHVGFALAGGGMLSVC